MAIKLGEQNIGKIMLGDRPIKKVILGDRLVFHKDFEFLDSVESTGVQYIDTNIVPTQNSLTNIIFKQENDVIDSNPFGSRISAYNNQYTMFQGGGQRLFYAIGINSYEKRDIEGLLLKNKCEVTFSPYNFSLKYNNKTLEFDNPTFDASELANAVDMYLFGLNQNSSFIRNFTGKIYRFNHNDNNSIDLIPCQNKTTKEIGMYDKISGQFFRNSGSGQFFGWHKNGDIALPLITQSFDFSHIDFSLENAIKILNALQEVGTPQMITFSAYTTSLINASNNALAKVYDAVQKGWTIVGEGLKEYVELEYIESTGTQWIDTGIYPDYINMPNVSSRFMFTDFGTTDSSILGNRESGGGGYQGLIIGHIYSSNILYIRWYGGFWSVNNTTNINEILDFNTNKNDATITNGDDVYQYTFVEKDYKCVNSKIALFTTDYGTWRGAYGKCRIYSFKIDGYIDLIPIRKMDGDVCMYDKISGQFFTNKGSGQFIGGEPKQD